MEKVAAIKIQQYDERLVAAIRAADRILGWGSTSALRWLAAPEDTGLYGHHVLVQDEDEADGAFFTSPRLGECSWRFCVSEDGRIRGWSMGAEIELSPASAFARSVGGHWVRVSLLPSGEVEFDVDAQPSLRSWDDHVDWETGEIRQITPEELRAERIQRLNAAM